MRRFWILIFLFFSSILTAATQGPNFPNNGTTDSSNGGTITWANPNLITSEDGSSARASTTTPNNFSQWLVGSQFGFNIPAGSVVNGFIVNWKKVNASPDAATIQDKGAKLVVFGVVRGTDHATGNWPSTLQFVSYGGTTDLWGLSNPLANTVNDPGFGAAIACNVIGVLTKANCDVDAVKITVYYTPPSGAKKRLMISQTREEKVIYARR